MKLATWNVNSLKIRLPHVLDWLQANPVDVLCLQETKLVDDKFPVQALEAAGYHALYSGQPTYNGVAVLTRADTVGKASLIATANPHFDDPQKRLLVAATGGLAVVCAYFPNGQEVGSDKYTYKLAWIDALIRWLGELREQAMPLVLAGDFNIAPEDRDVHDPAAWAGKVLFSEPERERFTKLCQLGLVDTFRLFEQPPKSYSWWDYRMLAFRRNAGLRIDHVLIDQRLAGEVSSCAIDKDARRREQPSDHAPVVMQLET